MLYFSISFSSGFCQTLFYFQFSKLINLANRFKGLDLIDRVPEELWTGSQHCPEGTDQNHLTEKEMPEGNWLSEEALQIAEKKEK